MVKGLAKRRIWVLIGVAGVLLAAVAAGLYPVRPGEVALIRGAEGRLVEVREAGWHWRLPFGEAPRRVPREPLELRRELSLEPEGAGELVVAVSGRFGVEVGSEAKWVEAAGWEPFVDALERRLAPALESAAGGVEPESIFQPELTGRLTRRAAEELAALGVAAESLAVSVPPERNGTALARVQESLVAHGSLSGRKVLVVGWDGADWLMIRPLLEAGRLPNLARLVEGGVSGELRSQMPLLSPLLWTTIATGKPVLEHGIADFLVRDPASGALVPISSASRRVHALWNLLEPFGLRTDVVAWWATWPAEPIFGTLVSDRVAYQLFEVQDTSNEGKVHPPEAWNWVARRLVPAESVGAEEMGRFVEIDAAELERLWTSLPPERRQEEKINHLRKILATTRSYHSILLGLLERQADLTLAYYEGTDTVGHLFARYLPPRLPGVSEDEVRRFGSALPEFYAYADELLGELLARVDEDTVVMLISDHGFFTGAARPDSDPADFAAGAPQWHRLHGVLVATGPGIRPGTVEDATILDLAPTVLAALGLPVPRDMPGRVLSEIVPERRDEPRRLASFEVLPRGAGAAVARGDALDRERLRELAALGYLSSSALGEAGGSPPAGSGAAPRPSTPPGPAAGGEDLQAVATEAYNRGRILQRQGDFTGAEREYRLAVERMPGFGPAYGSLAQIESLRGRHCRAFDILVQGFSRSGNLPMSAVTGLVDEAGECGRLPDAERALRSLHSTYTGTAAYSAALGLLYQKQGRSAEALASYARALEIDPLDHLANEQMVTLLRREGREQEARDFLAGAFEKAAGKVTAMNQLAVVALRQGWAPQAERLLRRVLEADPGNPGVLANLAASLMQQRRVPEALEAMRSAVRRDPDNAGNYFNLGAMLAEQGRFAEALEAFDTASEKGLRSARVHVAAAKMHFRLGDPAAAARELERALEVEPNDREATELLQILRTG